MIVPGKVEESELIHRVTSQDPDEVMPPPKFKKRPSKNQLELLHRWIKEGAKWEGHWSYSLPSSVPVPAVRDRRWPRNAIDHFVLARLESEKIAPIPGGRSRHVDSPRQPRPDRPASRPPRKSMRSRTTTIRTLTKRLVDRLLASPHYR